MINKEKHIIKETISIKQAMFKLNDLGADLTLFVVDEFNHLVGVVTDGDIRRGLINGFAINDNVNSIMNKHFHFIRLNDYSVEILGKFRDRGIKLLPLIDDNFFIIEIYNLLNTLSILPIDVVIMAGGRGERLRPLTDVVPKPMLLIGDKPILEHNIDRLAKFGVKNIYISVKYLSDQIINYFNDGSNKNLNIKYITEENPLGTVGALSQISNFENETILIMNSDILSNINFEDFYTSFRNDSASLSIAATGYKVNIPYAVLECTENNVQAFKEKPTYTYYSNAGIYLIKKELLKLIPKDTFYNATDLIEELIKMNEKVTSFEIRDYWLDIGKHDDFKKANKDIHVIKL